MARERRFLDVDNLVHLYSEGTSCKQLADQFGVDRSTILSRLISAGVQPRNRSEAERLKWSLMRHDRGLVERQCASAWDAAKRANADEPALASRSIWRERTGFTPYRQEGRFERLLINRLRRTGHTIIPQKSCGRYNIDLAFDAFPVAVEICCSAFHRTLRAERTEYILDRGWSVLFIWRPTKGRVPFRVDLMAEQTVAFLNQTRRHPSTQGQYGMIRCDGEFASPRGHDHFDATRVPGF